MSSGQVARRARVVIVQPWLRHYRLAFCMVLRDLLADAGVVLDLVYSTPRGSYGGRGDTAHLPWATHVHQREWQLGSLQLTWQPCLDIVRSADLVIVEQATRRLLNYVLLAQQARGGALVAFWGHGRNFQATSRVQAAAEATKRVVSRQGHWFFAYNELTADVLQQMGYPRERTTVVANSIDTVSLTASRDSVTEAEKRALRDRLGLRGEHVAIYCGAMYPEKRLPFLIESSLQIRARIPDFELICIGAGVDRDVVGRAAAQHDWIHAVGPQFGDDLARHFALARVHLMPGLVGLAVLDSFVLGVPLITTSNALHSPEIAYLQDGVNGVMVQGAGEDGRYADAATAVLTDPALQARLVEGCNRSAKHYSAEAMAGRFAEGVLLALEMPPRGLARLGRKLRR